MYIDTIECFARTRFSIELKNALRKATGRKVWDEPTRDGYGWILFINGPTIDAINVLEQHWIDRMWLTALHVALEFDAINGTTRDELIKLIDKHFHIKRRRSSDEMFTVGETRYSVDTALRRSRGQRKASKIGVAYHDRPGKLDGELDKPRYEVRLESSRAIKTMGFHTPVDLLAIKPREFAAKVLTIKQHKGILETIINRSIAIEAAKPDPLPHAERRIRSLIRRAGLDCVSGFARSFPKQFERLPHWDCIDIVEMMQWVPMKRVCEGVGYMSHVSQAVQTKTDDEVRELHCLLPPKLIRVRLDPMDSSPKRRIVRLRL
jgi:hypothetical protein